MYADLREFDIVLFRKSGGWFTDFIGNAIEWCQKGMGCQSPEFVHVGVAMEKDGELQVFETNPPSARYRDLKTIDWDNVAVLGSHPLLKFSRGSKAQARKWCDESVGFKYDYGSIGGFLWLGLRGRLARKSTRDKMFTDNKVASTSRDVCSQLVDNLFLKTVGIDLVPAIGYERMVPGDLTLSEIHRHLYGRIGA